MFPLNGQFDWRPVEEAPLGQIVYGFFDAYTNDTGLHAHIRPVRRYTAGGDWFCGSTGHNLGFAGPLLISAKIPYPSRDQVRAELQKKLDQERARMIEHNAAIADYPPVPVGILTF